MPTEIRLAKGEQIVIVSLEKPEGESLWIDTDEEGNLRYSEAK